MEVPLFSDKNSRLLECKLVPTFSNNLVVITLRFHCIQIKVQDHKSVNLYIRLIII